MLLLNIIYIINIYINGKHMGKSLGSIAFYLSDLKGQRLNEPRYAICY